MVSISRWLDSILASCGDINWKDELLSKEKIANDDPKMVLLAINEHTNFSTFGTLSKKRQD